MIPPFVGLPDTTGQTICGYQGVTLSDEGCVAEPVVHLLGQSAGWGLVSLAACRLHEQIARSSIAVIDEHPYNRSHCRPGEQDWPHGGAS